MSLEEISKAFKGKLVGNDIMKQHVCEVLALMPDETITYITRTCWFMASFENAWAFTFTGNDLRDYHLIFLSDDLLNQNPEQIHYTIAHEIGHVVLGHRNSVFAPQPPEEIAQQEQEADHFAKKYT